MYSCCCLLRLHGNKAVKVLQVMAGLLNMADRADWRNCKLSKEDELQMVEEFKNGFREFDPAQ